MNPIVAAALIASASTGIVAIVGFWTSLRLAHSTAVRDRQAMVYQQLLSYSTHRTQARFNRTRTIRFDPETEDRLRQDVETYTPPNWYELAGSVQAFCPDSVVLAFFDADRADQAVRAARDAYSEAFDLNRRDPIAGDSDPHRVVTLHADYQEKVRQADEADMKLTNIVRDKMLGTRPRDNNRSLIGKLIYLARSRTALR